MGKLRRTEEEIRRLLSDIDESVRSGETFFAACKNAGVAKPSVYQWRKKYGQTQPSVIVHTADTDAPRKYKTKRPSVTPVMLFIGSTDDALTFAKQWTGGL